MPQKTMDLLFVCAASCMRLPGGKKINLILYLWCIIIYLFDYFVNYLSIELLILLHDFPYIIHDLIWDYCIKIPHCCSVGSHFHIKSDKDIKSASPASFLLEVKDVEKWSRKLAINIQTVVMPEKGGMISLSTNSESPCDWSS